MKQLCLPIFVLMKLLHTADWHLGKRLEGKDRLDEQRAVLNHLVALAEQHQPDAVLVAGDLFDIYTPGAEATELLYETLARLSRNGSCPVIAIAGNHDSPDRIEVPDALARVHGIFLAGLPDSVLKPYKLGNGIELTHAGAGVARFKFPNYTYSLQLLLTPYANPYRLKKAFSAENEQQDYAVHLQQHWQQQADEFLEDNAVNVLLAHLYFNGKGQPVDEPEDENAISVGGAYCLTPELVPRQIHYTALGHLHSYHQLNGHCGKMAYSGSLMEYSFAKGKAQKYALLVELEPGKEAVITPLELQGSLPLHKKIFDSVEDALPWLHANQQCHLQLTIGCETHITSNEQAQLNQAHPNIAVLIPKPAVSSQQASEQVTQESLNDIDALFKQYFFAKEGNEAPAELMHLFHEVLNTQNSSAE